MFGGSSQRPTFAECAVIKSLGTVHRTKQCSAEVGNWEEPLNIWLTVAKNTIVGWALNFKVLMSSKGAISSTIFLFFESLELTTPRSRKNVLTSRWLLAQKNDQRVNYKPCEYEIQASSLLSVLALWKCTILDKFHRSSWLIEPYFELS